MPPLQQAPYTRLASGAKVEQKQVSLMSASPPPRVLMDTFVNVIIQLFEQMFFFFLSSGIKIFVCIKQIYKYGVFLYALK